MIHVVGSDQGGGYERTNDGAAVKCGIVAIHHRQGRWVERAYSFDKIQRVLGLNGAKLNDIVKMTSYLTSQDFIGPYIGCRNAAFKAADAELPAETLVIINRLAWPDMMMEVDVDAVVQK